jgi:hypothetical protein
VTEKSGQRGRDVRARHEVPTHHSRFLLGAFAGEIAIEQLALDAVGTRTLRQRTRSEGGGSGEARYSTYREPPDRYTSFTRA